MGELIAVLSGKGGTGKTTVCAGIATALAAAGNKVLCIDCDVGLRNLDLYLGMSDAAALSFLEVCRGDYPLSQAAQHPEFSGLSFLTAPMNCRIQSIDREAFGDMLLAARKEFDYVLLDSPAGVDDGFRLTAAFADRCVLVTGPSPAALRDATRVGELLELMGKTNVRLIVNRVNRRAIRALAMDIDDMMDSAGLPLLGIVPEDFHAVMAVAGGKPLLKTTRGGAAAACKRIARRIQGLPEPITFR